MACRAVADETIRRTPPNETTARARAATRDHRPGDRGVVEGAGLTIRPNLLAGHPRAAARDRARRTNYPTSADGIADWRSRCAPADFFTSAQQGMSSSLATLLEVECHGAQCEVRPGQFMSELGLV